MSKPTVSLGKQQEGGKGTIISCLIEQCQRHKLLRVANTESQTSNSPAFLLWHRSAQTRTDKAASRALPLLSPSFGQRVVPTEAASHINTSLHVFFYPPAKSCASLLRTDTPKVLQGLTAQLSFGLQ